MGSLRSWSTHGVEAVDDEEAGNGSSKHLTDFEVNHNEVLKPLSRQGSSASSSSSSSNSSQHQLVINGVGNDDKSEQPGGPQSPISPLGVSCMSSSEQSPQHQNQNNQTVGEEKAGYEPNRIPSSIFSSKPATPMEWSTASNESLFSIHLGNNSFSKDQFFMLYKSGELTKFDEQILAQGNLPPLEKLEDITKRNIENMIEMKGSAATDISMNSIMTVQRGEVAAGDQSHQKPPPAQEIRNNIPVADNHSQDKKHNSLTNSISVRSDGSNNSTRSFAFPVLTGEGGARISLSVNGEQNNNKPGLQAQSQKQSTAEEVAQPQTPATPQNAAARSWFSWLSCCRCS